MQSLGGDHDELAQVAWLYHVGGLSQEEVSRALGISRFRVLRMLAEARERGLVRIAIEHETVETLRLADTLCRRHGLTEVMVAPVPPGAPGAAYVRQAVGIVAAQFLARIGRGDRPVTIGVGWGRSVAAMVDALSGLRNPGLQFVSLMGALARTSGTGPVDVCARLAALTGGTARFLPAPFLADSADDCAVILRQRLVQETLAVARQADHAIISVGECTPDAFIFTSGILSADDRAALAAAGAVADTTGRFFRADGTLADTDLNHRTPAVSLDDLRHSDVALLVAGTKKLAATRAVLRAGFVKRLVVDQATATALAETGP